MSTRLQRPLGLLGAWQLLALLGHASTHIRPAQPATTPVAKAKAASVGVPVDAS
jgi:hypothetical protein